MNEQLAARVRNMVHTHWPERVQMSKRPVRWTWLCTCTDTVEFEREAWPCPAVLGLLTEEEGDQLQLLAHRSAAPQPLLKQLAAWLGVWGHE